MLLGTEQNNTTTWASGSTITLSESFMNFENLLIYYVKSGRTTGDAFQGHYGEVNIVTYPSLILKKLMDNDNVLFQGQYTDRYIYFVLNSETSWSIIAGKDMLVHKIYGLNRING